MNVYLTTKYGMITVTAIINETVVNRSYLYYNAIEASKQFKKDFKIKSKIIIKKFF